MIQVNLFAKQIDSQIENKLMLNKGERVREKLGVWD